MATEKQNSKDEFNDIPAPQVANVHREIPILNPDPAELPGEIAMRQSRRPAKIGRIVLLGGVTAVAAGIAYNMLQPPENPDHRPQHIAEAASAISQPFDCELDSFTLNTKDAAAVRYDAIINITPRPGIAAAEQALLQDPTVSWSAPQLMIRQAQPGESLEQLAAKPVSADVVKAGYKQVDSASGEQTVHLAMSKDLPVATRAELLYVRPVNTQDDKHLYETTSAIHCGFLEQRPSGLVQIPYNLPVVTHPNTLPLPLPEN